ncbi:MAG: hypothetical protein P8171_25940 [Candidatus Thiodiazotropha sp.]
MSSYHPKDFVETAEGLIFAVVTADLEEQRILTSLRYRRTDQGLQKLATRQANELLTNQHPLYLYYSKARDVSLHGVPQDRVLRHHQPRQRLQTMRQTAPADEIEAKLIHLTNLFAEQGLDTQDIGVTGSLLIGAQKPNSDIDLVFYRREAFFKAREIIQRLLDQGVQTKSANHNRQRRTPFRLSRPIYAGSSFHPRSGQLYRHLCRSGPARGAR